MPHADAGLSAARAAMAAVCLERLPDATLGSVQLRGDQRRTLARGQRAVQRQGGCVIGEDVGRGKTFVALALARRWGTVLVVAPASLRSMWSDAAARAAVPYVFASHESLSLGAEPGMSAGGIIVDESHHFRTPSTRRYAMLARLAARAPVVLLSATPLQNRARDLAAQIALFHGERAFSLDLEALSRFVIRGDDGMDANMPIVVAPQWIALEADDGEVLRAILDLPPPARPLGGGDAGALRTMGLVRAWASSRAALQSALRSRRRLATAIAQGVEEGRAPTRQEARDWHAAEDVVQLGFPAILITGSAPGSSLPALQATLDHDVRSMERVAEALRATPNPDIARLAAIRQLRATHSASRIIAFSEYASTVTALFSAMRGDAGVGMLTARESRIASGRIARDELLARFAPVAQGARTPAAHDNVTLLLATDLLSEGVNLQDASVVLHLDLPWNPARLAQRVGRSRRPGGASEVQAYLLAPPASAAALLHADARLRRKLAKAERVMGVGFAVLPALAERAVAPAFTTKRSMEVGATAAAAGALLDRLEHWRNRPSSRARSSEGCLVAAVDVPTAGWLAALSDGRLVGTLRGVTGETLPATRHLAELAEGPSRTVHPEEARVAILALRAWLDAEQCAMDCGVTDIAGPLRRAVLHWTTSLTRSLRRHERAVALPLIARLRACLRLPLPLGAERSLAEHALWARHGNVDAVPALTEALRIAGERGPHGRVPPNEPERAAPVALIVFGPAASDG